MDRNTGLKMTGRGLPRATAALVVVLATWLTAASAQRGAPDAIFADGFDQRCAPYPTFPDAACTGPVGKLEPWTGGDEFRLCR